MERERSLKGLFIKYLISWLAGSVLLAVIGFVMMSLAMQRGLIYPANHGDTEYEQEKENLKNAEKIRAEDIPPLMAYAFLRKMDSGKRGPYHKKMLRKPGR